MAAFRGSHAGLDGTSQRLRPEHDHAIVACYPVRQGVDSTFLLSGRPKRQYDTAYLRLSDRNTPVSDTVSSQDHHRETGPVSLSLSLDKGTYTASTACRFAAAPRTGSSARTTRSPRRRCRPTSSRTANRCTSCPTTPCCRARCRSTFRTATRALRAPRAPTRPPCRGGRPPRRRLGVGAWLACLLLLPCGRPAAVSFSAGFCSASSKRRARARDAVCALQPAAVCPSASRGQERSGCRGLSRRREEGDVGFECAWSEERGIRTAQNGRRDFRDTKDEPQPCVTLPSSLPVTVTTFLLSRIPVLVASGGGCAGSDIISRSPAASS